MHAASQVRPPDNTSRLAHCKASSTGFRWAIVAMHATPSFTREVRAAIAPNRGMHSSRGLLKILSPTHIASITLVASAVAAMSMRSLGGVPRVNSARLDKVKPKVVFFFAVPASIGRARASFQARYSHLNRLDYRTAHRSRRFGLCLLCRGQLVLVDDLDDFARIGLLVELQD